VIHVARATTAEQVLAASHLFDDPATPTWAADVVRRPGHHLLLASVDGDPSPAGFVTGVEMVHPDKGCEMFLYELGVDEAHRGHGVGTALVDALAAVARSAGCYGMWVLTDDDNDAALRTYRRGGASDESAHVMLTWTFDVDSDRGADDGA
jgi:ribosomal protein S18 acetylase RimI-like enzyme